MITVKKKHAERVLCGTELDLGKFYVILNGVLEDRLVFTSFYCQGPIIINLIQPFPGVVSWFYNNGSFVESEKMRFSPVDIEIIYETQRKTNE